MGGLTDGWMDGQIYKFNLYTVLLRPLTAKFT